MRKINEFIWTTDSFSNALKHLERESKLTEADSYILIKSIQNFTMERGINLSELFATIENIKIEEKALVKKDIDARLMYTVLKRICEIRNISGYRICIENNWDQSNYTRERSLALSGKRKSFSLRKLYGMLSVLKISFTCFFLLCEDELRKQN